MESIGQELREAREARGLSLAEVEKETRIRQRFLEALEAGDGEIVGGDVYLRGFLRNYALYLGLNADELIQRAGLKGEQYQFGTTARLPDPDEGYQPRYIEAPLRRNTFPLVRVILLLLAAALVAGGALSFWGVNAEQRAAWLERIGIALPPTITPIPDAVVLSPTATTTVASVISDTLPISATVTTSTRATAVPTATRPPRTPTPDPSSPTPEPATATPEATATPPPTQLISLIVEAVAPAWTEIYVDGANNPNLYRTLQSGDLYQFEAQQSIYLRCGNSAGLRVILNGEDLGTLAQRRGVSVRRWEVDPNGGPPILVEALDD